MSRTPGMSSDDLMHGLQMAEATYRLLVEGVPAIMYIDAPDELSTNLYTSPQVEGILGITPTEWSENPNTWFERMHPDDVDRVRVENDTSNRTGEPFHSEYRMISPDGRVVWFRDEAVLVRDDDGTPLFWRGVMLDITELKNTEEKLKRSLEILSRTLEQRQILVSRLEEAQEQERRQIAADIHDDSIQVMSAIDMRLQMLAEETEDPKLRAELEEVHRTVLLAVERLRHLMFAIRPPMLDREGLVAAVRLLLDELAEETGIETSLEVDLEREPAPEVRAIAFRIAREGLYNVRKHAEAGRVDVRIEGRDRGVRIRIADDGRGFEISEVEHPAPGHLGLSAMRERAELSGGRWRIESEPGRGTTIEFWLPASIAPRTA